MKILQQVIDSLPGGTISEIHTGECWNAVVVETDGAVQCGMASTPPDTADLEGKQPAVLHEMTSALIGKPAKEVCRLAFDTERRRASIGVATINALLPRHPELWVERNAEDVIAERGKGKRVAMVGHFPSVPRLREMVGRLDVLELRPQPGDYPAEAAAKIIPLADVVAITGMTLINDTLEGLLKLCRPEAYVIMLGPSVLLSPILFDYGVDLLGGSIVEKIDPVLRGVDEGIAETIFPLGVRRVIMAKPQG